MNKNRLRWIHLVVFCLLAILIGSSVSFSAQAGEGSPADMLQQAWRNAQRAGSYRFISDIDQTFVPRPVPEMIGQQETPLNLAMDGAVILPDRVYSEMKVRSNRLSNSVVMLRDGEQSFMLQDGQLKPVNNVLNLVSQNGDVLSYLVAADQVTLLDPPENHPEFARYSFVVDGPRYAEYIRQQAQAAMRAEPGAPQELTLQSMPALQQIRGRGELWVNQEGFPVRQVLDLKMPQVNEQYGASIHMMVDLSSYGKVESLPQAVQGPDGTWQLDGPLAAGSTPDLGAFPGFGAQTAQIVTSEPTPATTFDSLKARLAPSSLLHISPTSVILFTVLFLAMLVVRYYRRNPKHCYALIVFILIPIMVLTPILESEGVVSFFERQAQAAEASAAAVPELMRALGLNVQASDPDQASASVAEPAPLTPQQLLNQAASNRAKDAPIYDGVIQTTSNQGQEALGICGDGEPDVDTDNDGLTDQVENCLGTVANNSDTDNDLIPDGVEVSGFEYKGKHWSSDPLSFDSNRDGATDTMEWSSLMTPKGQAVNEDLDGDDIPNIWDDDDDGDDVPDAFDLSPAALTDFTTEFSLSSQGGMSSGTEAIEIEVQPLNMDHLRYSTTLLDWPFDEDGNIRDLDDSKDDLRLVPFLLISTNVMPDDDLLAQYGTRGWYDEEQGEYILLVTLQPLGDGGAIYAFYGKVAYAATDLTQDIQWNAKVVWMAQMQQDSYSCRYLYYQGKYDCDVNSEPTFLHQYEETFRVTGLQVTKSESYETAVVGTPGYPADDLYLFKLLIGLNNTFQSYQMLENQSVDETALEELYVRFTEGGDLLHTFGIPAGDGGYIAMTEPGTYPNAEAGMADLTNNVLPNYLNTYTAYSAPNCNDAYGAPVACASLVMVSENHIGSQDLSQMRGAEASMVDLDQLNFNLDNIPVFVARNTNLRMYEKNSVTLAWETMTPARMLEMVEARYHDIYGTIFNDSYPSFQVQGARFIAYTAYLWAYGGLFNAIFMDGQALVPELPDEQAEALASAIEDAFATCGLDYIGFVSNLPGVISYAFKTSLGIYQIIDLSLKPSTLSGNAIKGKLTMTGFALAASVANMIMSCISLACGVNPDLQICGHETALMVANLLVGTLTIGVQVVALSIQIADAIIDHLAGVIAKVDIPGGITGIIGVAIGIAMTWISFGLGAGKSDDPIIFRMALASAIVTTVWLVVLAIINFIPVIGPIISAILCLIDYILSLFTGLFSDKQWSLAQVLLELFYSAAVDTTLESVTMGEFSSGLKYMDMGLIDGNSFEVSVPVSGVIKKEDRGDNDDLEHSYVKGELQPEEDPDDPQGNPIAGEAMNEDVDCPISDGKAYCSNTAKVGFALEPTINGTANFVARILYQTVWEEAAFYGAVVYKHHYPEGQIPEEDELEYNTLTFDVLPATLTELWEWSELGNPDIDGDGLTNAEEQAQGTKIAEWDSDGDGLSDWYEVEVCSQKGCDPMKPDTDGDGLNDALERRVGTRINQVDSDGDGLSDADELFHVQDGELVGGWYISFGSLLTLENNSELKETTTEIAASISSNSREALSDSELELLDTNELYWVSSDPLVRDDDGDSLNAYEERLNGLSPQATNALVPQLIFSVSPIAEIPDARPGSYWLPGTTISTTITLANFATGPVTSPLILTLPSWIDSIENGVMQGDRTPPMTIDVETNPNTNTVTWDFSGSNALQLYEIVSATVTAQVSEIASASGEIALDLLYGSTQMHKVMQVTVDGDDPNVSIISPSDGTYLRGSNFVVGGLTTDPTTWITERTLNITPQGGTTQIKELPTGQGIWAYTWEFPGTDNVYTLSAYAKDAMNHETTISDVTVTVDNTPPVATIGYQMDSGIVRLGGNATDNLAGVQWVQLMIDGQPWRNVPLDGATWSYDWQVGENAQGKHVVKARAIDYSSNQSAVVTLTITVDGVAPSSVVTRGTDLVIPPAVQPNTSFDISGVADEGGHLQQPATPADLKTGMDVFDDSTVWLSPASIHENDGGLLAAWIGDFNADRLSDLAVGLPGPDGDAGQVAILYGRAGGWPVPPDLEMLASSLTIYTGAPEAQLGSYVAATGDVNGDSRDDLLVAGRNLTDAYLIFGIPRTLGNVTLQSGQSGYRVLLQAPEMITGLAAAGDVDGDGFGDLLIHTGTTAYLVLGRGNPWPERIDVVTDAAASFANVTGAEGVGDVDNDTLAEWVTLADGQITLYGWNSGTANVVTTLATSDSDPHAVALGDVDADGYADWLYSNAANRHLVYGSGATPHIFTGYDGFFAAPGDVDGDSRADILLTDSAGMASLIGLSVDPSPIVLATIDGVGGAANAPYAAGADPNADGSADLLLIPTQAAAEARGFDAPDFSSGFISPDTLPLGVSSLNNYSVSPDSTSLFLDTADFQSLAFYQEAASVSDNRYVDDDLVCDGHLPCYQTIQEAVNASDSGGDKITVYPGVYAAFSIPAGDAYDYLTIEGISTDAVFIDSDGTGNAISIGSDGVHISNLTVRNAESGIALSSSAGEPTWEGGQETSIDHLLAHSVKNPISISQSAALNLSDSTLVGNGTDPMVKVDSTPNSAVYTWHTDQAMTSSITTNGGLAATSDKLYAMPGGTDTTVYTATPGADGSLSTWSPAFRVPNELHTGNLKYNYITAGGNYFFQMHPQSFTSDIGAPDFSAFNGEIRAVAVAPNGYIYVGGSFTTVGTTAVNHVAYWDGTSWHPLGTALSNGVNGSVYAITIVPNGDVYVGGQFSQASAGTGLPAHNIVRWSDSNWLTLGEAVVNGNGTDGPVYALTHTDDGVVAVGGQFEYVRASLAGFNANEFSSIKNFAVYNLTLWPDTAGWYCRTSWVFGHVSETSSVQTLTFSGGNYETPGTRFIIGGSFSSAGGYTAPNIAQLLSMGGNYGDYYRVEPLSDGIAVPVTEAAIDPTTNDIYAVSSDTASEGVYRYADDGSGTKTWFMQYGYDIGSANALAVDMRGNVYVGTVDGILMVDQPPESVIFDLEEDEGAPIWDIVLDSALPTHAGQVLVARGSTGSGGVRHWSLEGLFRRNLSGTSWEWITYPVAFNHSLPPDAMAADPSGNVYASQFFSNYSLLYRLNAGSQTWDLVASLSNYRDSDPNNQFTLTDLAWANGYLYGLTYSSEDSGQKWYLYRYDPASSIMSSSDIGPNVNWTQMDLTPLPSGTSLVSSRSWTWDGADSIYLLQSGGTYRYRLSTNSWDSLGSPTISFTLSQKPAMVMAGNHLYVYATPGAGVTTNLFRYGAVGMPDLRLTIRNTALVEPDSATSSLAWMNLSSTGGTYRFQVDADTTNTWIGPNSASWTPTLPSGATTLISTQADFVAPEDDLYRLGPDSELTAGYHHYKEVAHVYLSETACSECTSGGLTWGEDAFATVREAVESGAARVLVHPGRYPQTFYLVSGVEVIGSGAELTIIESPEGTASALVTAEGVSHASLARLALVGGPSWDGFLAEGGANGLKLTRTIIRGLDTGLLLSGGSQVEIVNNTIVENTNGVVIEGTTPVNVRNTIFAYNSGTGLTHGICPDNCPTSLANTYNDFWSNGIDMVPQDVSIGSLFVDPRFRDLIGKDLRLTANSPLIDMGSPNDPTPPGGGERVDIGYAEYNAAGVYVSQDYSETGLNDGLTWGIDAFDRIQPALDAAATAIHDLNGVLPDGGYSVAVDSGNYSETIRIPSHVRLVGTGAENTTIDAENAGSVVTFDAVIDSELSGFKVKNAGSNGSGVEIINAASGIKIYRNILLDNQTGISLTESSSAQVLFTTIVNNSNEGVYASGLGSWVDVRNSILDGNGTGLKAENNALIRNSYNLLNNLSNLSNVTAGEGTLYNNPSFAENEHYFLTSDSAALDAADPLAEVPAAGGLRADLGYKELMVSPLVLLFGPQIDPKITGNTGVAQVEVGVVKIANMADPLTETLPTTWETLTPGIEGQPLFYWSKPWSESETGLYRVYSRATDQASNVETEPLDWYEGAFVVDDTPPQVTWVTQPPGTTDAAAVLAAVNASGTVSTSVGTRPDVAQVYFSVTQPDGNVRSYPAEDGQAWIELPVVDSGTAYTITAIVVDEAGNLTETSTQVTVASDTSVATVTSPVSGSAINSVEVSLHGFVRFSASGDGSIDVNLPDGSTVQATLGIPGAQFSSWSAEFTLPDGEITKTVTVIPSLNEQAGTSKIMNLTLDTTSPTLDLTSPVSGDVFTQTVSFSGSVSDSGSGLECVEVSVDGGFTWRETAISGNTWELDWDQELNQDYVSYPARVRAFDNAGNLTVIKRAVVVDNVPPTDLAPVTFNPPIGQHLEVGIANLSMTWGTPIDASGSAQILMAVDQNAEVDENTVFMNKEGNAGAASLNDVGDWYVHMAVQDAAGNQVITQYGPWHLRDTTNETFMYRRESIILDGYIDLEHDEWQATDLLGIDARSGNLQELYTSWDGEYVYLGWSGAWWTLDGVLWAYLDTADSGSPLKVDGSTLPSGFLADQAVEINGPGDGSLWSWNGTWVETPLSADDFTAGQAGDTEVRVLWPASASGSLNLVALALPREAEAIQTLQGQALSDKKGSMALVEGETPSLEEAGFTPWAVFPTTNPLEEIMIEDFAWTNVSGVTDINSGQPTARTVYMTVSSPQSMEAAWCGGNNIVYDILLENPEAAEFSGLTLTLTASSGLSYVDVEGATLSSGVGGSIWTLDLDPLAAGASMHVGVTAQINDETASSQVSSTIVLLAGTTPLTPESHATKTVTHRVDQQVPVVGIDTLGGSAIAAGSFTFTGYANDDDGSGVERIEISTDGDNWQLAEGTLGWSVTLEYPSGMTDLDLYSRAIDQCGYVSSTDTQSFIVDTTPPDVVWTSPEAVTDALAAISGTASDPVPAGSLVRSVEVQVDNENGAWNAASLIPNQGWTWNWITPREDGEPHQLRVRASDTAGNLTTTGWQLTIVDVVAPQLTVEQKVKSMEMPGDLPGITTEPGQLHSEQANKTYRLLPPQPLKVVPGVTTQGGDRLTSLATVQDTGPILIGTVTDGSEVQVVRVLVYDPLGGASIQEAALSDGEWVYAPDLTGWVVGTYALRVQAVDKYGNLRMMGPYQFEIKDVPIVGLVASYEWYGVITEPVNFVATTTFGTNVIYTWDFGDGEIAEGGLVQHLYAGLDVYTVKVTAKNSVSEMTTEIQVTIMELTVEAGVDQMVNEGDMVSIEASFQDGLVDADHTASIDWGDDSTSSGVINETEKTVSGSHVYTDDGVYTVKVTVVNGQGNSNSDTLTVTTSNVAPTVTLMESDSANEGDALPYSYSTTDPGDDTFSLLTGYPSCGPNGILFDASFDPATGAGSFMCTFPDGPATSDVAVQVQDSDGANSNISSISVDIANVTPTVTLSGPHSVNEGGTVSYSYSTTDPGDDTISLLTGYPTCGSKGILSDPIFDPATSTGSFMCTFPDGPANSDVAVQVQDSDGANSNLSSFSVDITNVTPTVTVDPETQTCQYSDSICEVTFMATDVAADTLTASWSESLPVDLKLTENCPKPDNDIWQTCTWTLTGTMDEAADDYEVKLIVTDEDTGSGSARTTINVVPEDADIWLDEENTVAVQVSLLGTSPDFSLTAYVQEIDTDAANCIAQPGDIDQAKVAMTLAPIGSGSPVEGNCWLVGNNGETGYAQIATFACDFENVKVNTYEVQASVTGGNYTGGPDEDVLVVYDPSLGFTTGGGWFYWPGTANPETGYPGERTNFGYTMKYNKKATNVQGSLLLIRHLPDGSIYRVKSNVIYGLALGEDSKASMGWASFSGKSTYQEPSWPEPIGNYEFLVYVEDLNEPGTGTDRFWIKVIDGLAMLPDADDNAIPLEGGNLVVPHRAR